MEPILPTPSNLEQPTTSANQQSLPIQHGVESAPNTGVEQPHEGVPTATASPTVTPMPAQSSAPGPIPQAVTTSTNPPTNDSPQIADDVDVIEKEWVDKAKKIVSATKEDPRQQGKQVGELQADYLMKRYNKQIKLSE